MSANTTANAAVVDARPQSAEGVYAGRDSSGSCIVALSPDRRLCDRCRTRRFASVGRSVSPAAELAASLAELTQTPTPATLPGQVLTALDEPDRSHIALPLPDCDCAQAGPAAQTERAGAWPLHRSVSDWVGPVRGIWSIPTEIDGLHVVISSCADLASFGLPSGIADGMGVSFDEEGAMNAAIGECLERYAASWPVQKSILATSEELVGPRVEPDPGALADDPRSAGQPIRWLAGQHLATAGECHIAAAAAYLAYQPKPGERPAPTWTSAGLAAGPTLEWALEKAVLERIERDTYMRAWRLGGPFERIVSSPIGIDGLTLLRIPCGYGAEVVWAILARPEPPYVLSGIAARRGRQDATWAAITEACGEQTLVRAGFKDVSATGAAGGAVAKSRAYATDSGLAEDLVRWASSRPIATEPQPILLPDVAAIGAMLGRGGWVDLSTTDTRAFGVHVARVVVPGLVDMEKPGRPSRLTGSTDPHPLD